MSLCNQCGAVLADGAEFCGECGATTGAPAARPAPAPFFPSDQGPQQVTPISPLSPPVKSGGGGLKVLVSFAIGAAVMALVFVARSNNSTYNSNFNLNSSSGSNVNSGGGFTTNLNSTTNTGFTNLNSNSNLYSNMNANMSSVNANYGNTNANVGATNSNRGYRSKMEIAEAKILNYQSLYPSDVSGLSCFQLRVLRNTVYAREGLTFPKHPELQSHFDNRTWYEPDYELTDGKQIARSGTDEANFDVIIGAELNSSCR